MSMTSTPRAHTEGLEPFVRPTLVPGVGIHFATVTHVRISRKVGEVFRVFEGARSVSLVVTAAVLLDDECPCDQCYWGPDAGRRVGNCLDPDRVGISGECQATHRPKYGDEVVFVELPKFDRNRED